MVVVIAATGAALEALYKVSRRLVSGERFPYQQCHVFVASKQQILK